MTDLSPTRSAPAAAAAAPTAGPTTHERLLAAATALFAERGYGGTSMADIAARVGVRKASLYNYYPSKDDLLMDLLERSLRAASECCAPALEGPGTVEERLWGYVRGFVGFAREYPELLAIFRLAAVQIGGELGERVERVVVALKERQRRRLDEVFAEAVAAGEVVAGDPRRHAYVFRAFVNVLLLGHLDCHCGERPDDRCLREAWELFWHGMAARRGVA